MKFDRKGYSTPKNWVAPSKACIEIVKKISRETSMLTWTWANKKYPIVFWEAHRKPASAVLLLADDDKFYKVQASEFATCVNLTAPMVRNTFDFGSKTKCSTRMDKQEMNAFVVRQVARNPGLALVLDGIDFQTSSLLATRNVSSVITNPFLDPETIPHRDKIHLVPSVLLAFLTGAELCVWRFQIRHLLLDYCCTWSGNESCVPKHEVQLALHMGLLQAHAGILWLTLSLRGIRAVDRHKHIFNEVVSSLSGVYPGGFVLDLCRYQLYDKGNMVSLVFRSRSQHHKSKKKQ